MILSAALIQTVKGGVPELQGRTWVHPYVASKTNLNSGNGLARSQK